jgi:hypothetical protein
MKIKILVLAIACQLCATGAYAYDFAVANADGVTIYYDKSGSNASVTNGANYSGNVVIPSQVIYSGTTYNVTSIGKSAFFGCSGLTSVTIGNSVTDIGSSAFYGCSRLTSVTIPNSVEIIGKSAFSYCSSLKSITIPNSVTDIGSSVFFGCSGLTSITIPNSVEIIGKSAFSGCSGLTEIHSKNPTLPNAYYDSFSDIPFNTSTLYVPKGSKSAYQVAQGWNYFKNIIEEEVGNAIAPATIDDSPVSTAHKAGALLL